MSARRIIHGDALERLRELDTNSAHGMVTDPPSGTGFMGKQWDKNKGGRDAWVAWLGAIFTEARRVLVPGAYVLVWALPRTSHWTALALEAGGFEIRDSLHHVFGSGFPKSLDVSKAIDKAAGAEREVIGRRPTYRASAGAPGRPWQDRSDGNSTAPATDDAKRWQGFGTALKPAHEVWWLARAPLGESSIARNVLEHGAGAVNVDGCRVGDEIRTNPPAANKPGGSALQMSAIGMPSGAAATTTAGRWPPNFLLSHDCDDACRDGCPVGELEAASRFFPVFKYAPKPSRAERSAGLEGMNNHPTVKPAALMRWLVRLVTPPDGVVLDPFTGSGTTAAACALEGFGFVGIEQDAGYVEMARRRVSHFERLAVMPSADVAMRGSQGQRGMFEGLA